MESRCVYSSTVAPIPFILQLLTIGILFQTVRSHCRVENCSRQYAHALEVDHVKQGPNLHYCVILKNYSECIRATARSCRGNLKYHTTSSLVIQWNNEYNCSYIVTQGELSPPVTRLPRPRPTPSQVCSYPGRHEFKHCGLFGDPHLRTFDDKFQTCKVLGAWPLIDNAYLAVQVTNEAVVKGSSATATSKLTIIIKGGSTECAQEKTYEAQTDNLPSAFIDGTQTSGPDRSVRIDEKEPQKHIEIHIRYIATTIVVRQVGRYLTFAIRMPKTISELGTSSDGLQLCVKGCPSSERINYKQFLSYPSHWIKTLMHQNDLAMTRHMAITKCREYNVTDFYFDSCVFDLLTTGDTSFREAANNALQDVAELYPDAIGLHENRTSLPSLEHSPGFRNSGANTVNSAPGRTIFMIVLLLVCSIVFTNR